MEKSYTHKCVNTCSSTITISWDENTNKILDIQVVGGCPGNLQGIIALCKGQDINEVHDRLKDIKCRNKPTSCPDQLAVAIEEAIKN